MKVALQYDDDAYVEIPDRQGEKASGRGLWGRHVAGREFLDAYLTYGEWDEVVALVRNRASRQSITSFCRRHPSSTHRRRRLQIVHERDFLHSFCLAPPASVLYTPQPPDERYAWTRQHCARHRFAICGLTHTLCSARANRWLISLITAPFEEYDVLICTSRAVVQMVRSLFDAFTDYLQDRFGGVPRLRPQLECIPLGVNTDKFRPPSSDERAEQRGRLDVHEDEMVVLYVGRLSAHGKAHPFPIFRGLQDATRRTGHRFHLVLSGWAKGEAILNAFVDGARAIAPDVRLTVIDGTDPAERYGAWKAADVFTSLSDNLQETFGLVIVEAMASGLPVVASDWNGYRDLVVDGQTGFLIPTAMLPGATVDSTASLLLGAIDYDRFIGQCNQAAVIDNRAAGEAFARLANDAVLRRRMGDAGRRRACEQFSWRRIIGAYEAVWKNQVDHLARHTERGCSVSAGVPGPSMYPAPEHSFAGYPSRWLEDEIRVVADENSFALLETILALPLTNYAGNARVMRPSVLRQVLQAAMEPQTLRNLKHLLATSSRCRSSQMASATLAWMLKYDLLKPFELIHS